VAGNLHVIWWPVLAGKKLTRVLSSDQGMISCGGNAMSHQITLCVGVLALRSAPITDISMSAVLRLERMGGKTSGACDASRSYEPAMTA
jgi:hypothetical protein